MRNRVAGLQTTTERPYRVRGWIMARLMRATVHERLGDKATAAALRASVADEVFLMSVPVKEAA